MTQFFCIGVKMHVRPPHSFSSPIHNLSRASYHGAPRTEHQPRHLDPVVESRNEVPAALDRQKIVDNKLIYALEKVVGSENVSISALNPDDYTPENVADRVLGFVNQAMGKLENTQPNYDKAAFLSAVSKGIDEGFADAREFLQGLGALEGQIEEDIDTTYSLIQDGLAKLDGSQLKSASASMELQSFSAQMSRSAQVEVRTKEGDIIKIALDHSAASSRSDFNLSQEGVNISGYQSSLSSSSNMNIEIEGDLNSDETKELKHLLEQMDTVGKDFFSGNTQSAFDHAGKIGLKGNSIASFSMNLDMTKSVQAVAAYQQASIPDQNVQPDHIKQVSDFFNRAQDLLETAKSALTPFEDPMVSFQDLFAAVNQANTSAQETEKVMAPEQAMSEMIMPLSQAIFTNDQQ